MANINSDFYKVEKQDAEFSDIDRVIRGYIMAMDDENCDKAIQHDPRREVFMELSSLRASTISWYPFKENATVLEVESGFGALTGALCEKASRVVVTEPSFFRAKAIAKRYEKRQNLQIYAGDIEDMLLSEMFDYILLCGVLEKVGRGSKKNAAYTQYLRSLQKYLKPDGKILIAVDNLYSLCNWNDRKEITQQRLTQENKLCFFHRRQLQEIADDAGLVYQKFYYPMPDYRITGCVYTDECVPTVDEWQRLAKHELQNISAMEEDKDTLKNLIENGEFPFFANSFFLEAGKTAIRSNLDFKMVLSGEKQGTEDRKKRDLQEETFEKIRFLEQLQLKPAIVEIDQDRRQLEKVMEIQMDLLKRFKEVCEQNNLTFYMIYGTLLGAVRHGGMIPGDDDIDIAMPREDYNKLLELGQKFEGKYFLQTPWNDNCFFGGYLKLRNKETTAIHPQNWWVECCEGIGIDIFPLDNGYSNKYMEKWKEKRICFWQRMLYAKAYGFFAKFKDMPLLQWKAYKYMGMLFSRKYLADKLNCVMAKGDCKAESPFGIYAHYSGTGGYRGVSRKDFEETVMLSYEDMKLPAPIGRYEVLARLYGNDYMTPIGWQEWKQRHGFYRADVSYTEYKECLCGLLKPAPVDKDIVLFGDGLLFEAYFKRYRDRFKPTHIVLLEEERLVDVVHGIQTECLEDFNPEDKKKIYPVICSVNIAGAEEKLKQAGYKQYHIFVENRNWLLLANWSWALKEIKESGI